ncbi:hypothetical protein MNU13_30865, partial [Pseudomonas aeruginosa]|uniref:hypothetical protein n=3 Tax=Pseudomonas aeruginosa TaxID=287 RepID=UPI001FB62746
LPPCHPATLPGGGQSYLPFRPKSSVSAKVNEQSKTPVDLASAGVFFWLIPKTPVDKMERFSA